MFRVIPPLFSVIPLLSLPALPSHLHTVAPIILLSWHFRSTHLAPPQTARGSVLTPGVNPLWLGTLLTHHIPFSLWLLLRCTILHQSSNFKIGSGIAFFLRHQNSLLWALCQMLSSTPRRHSIGCCFVLTFSLGSASQSIHIIWHRSVVPFPSMNLDCIPSMSTIYLNRLSTTLSGQDFHGMFHHLWLVSWPKQ